MKKYKERFCNWLGNDVHPVFVTIIAYLTWLGICFYTFLTGDDGSQQQLKRKQGKDGKTLYKRSGLLHIFDKWK